MNPSLIDEKWYWKTTSFVAALPCNALTAPMVLDEPTDGVCFCVYATRLAGATPNPGYLVIADNLSGHKVTGIREDIEAGGSTIRYLPPCSRDINSIEKLLAKLKT